MGISSETHTWEWHSWEGLPYLRCRLLQNWPHGFLTHSFWPRPPQDLVQVLQSDASAYRVKQVHGNRVVKPSEITAEIEKTAEDFVAADGLVTEAENQAIWVATADCTPVLIADAETGQVAAIHAGWRGTAKRIVPEAIALKLASGSSLENLRIAIGPAIAGTVYQVSEEVAVEVGKSIIPSQESETEAAILEVLRELPNSPLLDDPEPGKVKLDVRRVNEIQLQQLGIKDEQIAIAPYCTYEQPDYFFSYRRTQEKKVQWSGIVSRKH